MAKRSKKSVMDPGSKVRRLEVRNLGPIRNADVRFGDLTTLVGPQATGKSIFLQTLKLAIDHAAIRSRLDQSDAIQLRAADADAFLQLVYGEGMHSIWGDSTEVLAEGFPLRPRNLLKPADDAEARVFYVPAQRVMSLRDGFTRPFGDYKAGDPFVLRSFSQELHDLIQKDFLGVGRVFPKTNRLTEPLRKRLAGSIYGSFELEIEQQGLGRRFVLHQQDGQKLPFLVWSAGQREFTPLLLGVYWLSPPGRVPTRAPTEWVIIEEPEMGLHPEAILAVMTLVLALLQRGYRVVLSTHSPAVLDIQWVLRRLSELGATAADVKELLQLPSRPDTTAMAEKALQIDSRAYFFPRDGIVKDISSLDPGSPDEDAAGWGGLTGFSAHTGRVLARAVQRSEGSEA